MLLVVAAIFVLLLVVLIEAVVLIWPRGTESAVGGTLTALQGEVLVQKGGQGEWIEVAQDFAVEAGDRIRTASGSYAVVTFLEGTATELSELTELRVDALQLAGAQRVVIRLDLDAGQIWNRIAQLPADSLHEVSTLAATVVCHGSEYGVAVDGVGNTWVRGQEGQVVVSGGGSTMPVAPGDTLVVKVGSSPVRYAEVAMVPEAPAGEVTGSEEAGVQGGDMPTFLNKPLPSPTATDTPTATATSRPIPPSPTATATRRPQPTATTPVCPRNCPTFRINVPSTAPPYGLFGIEWDVLGASVPSGYAYVLEFSQDQASWGRTPPLTWKDSQGMGELWQAGGHTNAEIHGPGPGKWFWRVCIVRSEAGPSCCCGPSHTIEHQRDDGC